MIRLPPGSKRTYTLLPYTTLGRSLIDLVRQLVGAFIFGLELLILGVERFDRRLFLGREIEWLALQFVQTAGRVVGEADRDLDPQIGSAHACTPVTNAPPACRLLLDK